jgi:VWFA-related protein
MRRAFASVLVLAVTAVLAVGVRGDDPLAATDLVRFLRAGISERIILAELRDRGFGEPLDSTREAELRDAGASETLIVAVRRAAPASAPAAAGSPATATKGASRAGDASSFPTSTTRVHGPTFSASTRTVRVPVSVLDERGNPVMGLHGEDFQIEEDGRKQEVTYFSGERRPLRIALALDVSASMDNKIREVEAALRHFIDLLEPEDEILVLTFNDKVNVVQDFTSDRSRLARVLDKLEPEGATVLFDAAKEAIERVAPGSAESKAVVLVTDGMDTNSATTWLELRELAMRSEVPVFSIGLGSDFTFRSIFSKPRRRIPGGHPGRVPPWPGGGGGGRGGWPGGVGGGGGWPRGPAGSSRSSKSDFDASALLALAEETGARAEILKGLEEDLGNVDRLKNAVESIAMTLRHRYLVGYDPATGKRGWRKIKVDVDRPAVTARARKGYYSEG